MTERETFCAGVCNVALRAKPAISCSAQRAHAIGAYDSPQVSIHIHATPGSAQQSNPTAHLEVCYQLALHLTRAHFVRVYQLERKPSRQGTAGKAPAVQSVRSCSILTTERLSFGGQPDPSPCCVHSGADSEK